MSTLPMAFTRGTACSIPTTWTPTVPDSERESYPHSPYEMDFMRVRLSPECRLTAQGCPGTYAGTASRGTRTAGRPARWL
jgi:hypothetical protein